MTKDMAKAHIPTTHQPLSRLKGTGVKLSVTEKDTGKPVNYGVQLNNTTLEIEALPNLKVEVAGYSEMLEALKLALSRLQIVDKYTLKHKSQAQIICGNVLAKAEGKEG